MQTPHNLHYITICMKLQQQVAHFQCIFGTLSTGVATPRQKSLPTLPAFCRLNILYKVSVLVGNNVEHISAGITMQSLSNVKHMLHCLAKSTPETCSSRNLAVAHYSSGHDCCVVAENSPAMVHRLIYLSTVATASGNTGACGSAPWSATTGTQRSPEVQAQSKR